MTQSNLTFTESQQIPEGYKKIEFGIIPNDWETPKFGEICTLINGRGFKPYEWSKKGLPIIRIQNLNGSDDFNYYEGAYDPKIFIENGQLLFAWSGSRGTSFGPHIWKGQNALLNYHTWKLNINNSKVDDKYFYHILKSLTKIIEDSAHGASALVHTQKGEMEKFDIPLPPSRIEQQKIATVLSDTDALISELEKLIEKKQAIKTATMQQLLTGKTRLPEFALREDGTPKAYKNSELGQIPEDWDVYKVGEISDVLTGFPFPSSHYTDSGVRLLRGSNVKRGVTDWSEDITQYWPIISSDIKKYELKVGDIVISMDGSLVGRSFAQLDKSDLPAVLLQRVARVRSSDVDQNYLKQWICSEMFTAHCDAVKTVTAIPHISPDDIKTFRFVAPKCKKEQKQLSGILKDMEVEIQILNEKLTKLIMFKKGMMQELLTGKTRLV